MPMQTQHAVSATRACSPEEWELRCDLAALFRLAARFGMSDIIYTHISARLPGDDHTFLINPFGVLFKDITASSLVKIDQAGENVDGADAGVRVNRAGFNIHSAVHMSRPDLTCVIHSHTTAGMAVSAQKQGLLPITQHAMMFFEQIGFHDYESFATQLDERERIAHDLGDKDILILRNHGTLVGGRSVGEAFHTAYHLERACEAQIMALSGGAELNMPDEAVARATVQRMARMTQEHFSFFWNSCLGLLPPEERDYRR
jgi:ribulose-5-phosphate 4-epimerase/fuculose-1-phosphate aldolase